MIKGLLVIWVNRATENAGLENDGPTKIIGVENARLENGGLKNRAENAGLENVRLNTDNDNIRTSWKTTVRVYVEGFKSVIRTCSCSSHICRIQRSTVWQIPVGVVSKWHQNTPTEKHAHIKACIECYDSGSYNSIQQFLCAISQLATVSAHTRQRSTSCWMPVTLRTIQCMTL